MRLLFLLLASSLFIQAAKPVYDPTTSDGKVEIQLRSFTYEGREVPLKIYLPVTTQATKNTKSLPPVILLSHGLGGSREVGAFLGNHWAGRGFVVVAMQHIGSDDSAWKNVPLAQRFKALKQAANLNTFLDRMHDVPATINQLEKWNAEPANPLYRRMNLEKIGMSGHSYGAVTTQALCGQVFAAAGARYADKRIDAGLALSPSPPAKGDAGQAFSKIQIPMMMMTGTKDHSAIGNSTPESRREVYAALPAGSKYELVLKDAQHMAFSDRTLIGKEQRNPNHHNAIKALSTAFWETYLKDSQPARSWLDGNAPKEILDPDDVWQSK
jgi:predicted dienelactone hydrolase